MSNTKTRDEISIEVTLRNVQVERLRELVGQIDELLSSSLDCTDVAPELPKVLELALWAAEEELFDETGKYTCGHTPADWKNRKVRDAGWCSLCDFMCRLEHHARHVLKEV